jgi:sterol desaturase/sphingolipid hydroxylase (fatty acid hydroxylase superfamily)
MESIGLLLERQLPTILVGLFCILLQVFSPSIPGQKIWTKESGLNLQYFLAASFVFPLFYIFFIYFMFAGAQRYLGYDTDAAPLLAEQPIVLRIFLAMIVIDLVGYWVHRLVHSHALWPMHAIHHSSTEIDWLSAIRVHPVDQLLATLAQLFVAIVVVGFSLEIAATAGLLRSSYFLFNHANLNWSFGPLGYVMASPVFHRWHHTREAAGLNKNFGGLFSVWDHLFGTAYHPDREQPHDFGTQEIVGAGLLAQIGSPFASWARRLGSARRR